MLRKATSLVWNLPEALNTNYNQVQTTKKNSKREKKNENLILSLTILTAGGARGIWRLRRLFSGCSRTWAFGAVRLGTVDNGAWVGQLCLNRVPLGTRLLLVWQLSDEWVYHRFFSYSYLLSYFNRYFLYRHKDNALFFTVGPSIPLWNCACGS